MGLYSYPNRHTLKIVKLFPPGPLVHFYVVGWPKRGVNCKHVYTHRGSKQATGVDSKTCPLYNQRMRGGGGQLVNHRKKHGPAQLRNGLGIL